jgi:phosphoserine aminotransferase
VSTENRIFNFSSGPGVLPLPVLERARDEMLSLDGSGMSVMEMSHRSEIFGEILSSAEQGIRDLLELPDDYRVLFMQGGASLQFSMVPMNFLRPNGAADYVVTGVWGEKAEAEALKCGQVNVIYDGRRSGYRTVPGENEVIYSPNASYIHYTSNETIDGVEFNYDLDGASVAVICDASSNILSKPIDVSRYAMIYAGAQKNMGPSGVTVVIIKDELLERVPPNQHSLLDYRNFAQNHSMPNTPNTWGIYLIGLVCDWLKELGGVGAISKINTDKAAILYDAIDSSDGFYVGRAERGARSLMNVTFQLPTAELDDKFCIEAEAIGMSGLRGHRSVGGVRASLYNAFPKAGVERLVQFMSEFSAGNR